MLANGTYFEARQYLGRAEFSDLQSDVEGGKRKRRANPMYEDYDRGHRAKRTRLPMEQSCSSEDESNKSFLQLQPPPPPPPLPQFSPEPQSFMEQLGPAVNTSENTYWKDALRTILQCVEEVKSQVADLHRKVDLVLLHNTSGCEDLNLEVDLPMHTMEEDNKVVVKPLNCQMNLIILIGGIRSGMAGGSQ
ncbi:hypothetical protein SKAU_G00280290 [Synaphobranchus kaupii]|uniref:Uncharacterized protein n=1 Tax=Synaphobranchus kaupii TaxID=118154 RepID=A0A9Q1INY5_SYNKA|nr:hypothetical protein SKAU_G00280290 [Synaphobranchus kaupii]